MKIVLLINFIVLMVALTACQTATPISAVAATRDVEFTLTPGQTAALTEQGLTIKLIGVAGDERCPSEIECAQSEPVSISLSVQKDMSEAVEIHLQTFTDYNGRAPEMEFEGIKDRMVYEGYLIRVVSVLPYPTNLTDTIKDSEYHISLVVSDE